MDLRRHCGVLRHCHVLRPREHPVTNAGLALHLDYNNHVCCSNTESALPCSLFIVERRSKDLPPAGSVSPHRNSFRVFGLCAEHGLKHFLLSLRNHDCLSGMFPPLELTLLYGLILPAASSGQDKMENLDWQVLAHFHPHHDALRWASALYPVLDRFARFLTQFSCTTAQVGAATCVACIHSVRR
jgi:hypothetical protein